MPSIKYKYNPFSGVLAEDIDDILVPRIDIEDIISKINSDTPTAIEFLGKQGRGKTTHLIYLQRQMNEYPIFLLNANSAYDELLNSKSKIVFVDSIHHLNIFDRIKLFKNKKTIIYSTHWNRKLECYLASKAYYSFNFKGIDPTTLKKILNKRLEIATTNNKNSQESFTILETKSLIKKFGDNYRGIINHLYERYQQ